MSSVGVAVFDELTSGPYDQVGTIVMTESAGWITATDRAGALTHVAPTTGSAAIRAACRCPPSVTHALQRPPHCHFASDHLHDALLQRQDIVCKCLEVRRIVVGVYPVLSFEVGDECAVLDEPSPRRVAQSVLVKPMPADGLIVWTSHAGGASASPDQHDTALVFVVEVRSECERGPAHVLGNENRIWGIRLPGHAKFKRFGSFCHMRKLSREENNIRTCRDPRGHAGLRIGLTYAFGRVGARPV